MRIISGSHKGRTINPDKHFSARPTTDVAKEGLFNIINNNFNFEEIKVLDLFSGTGSISFEFASRGVKDITAVELNYHHFAFIKNTSKDLNLPQIKPIKLNAFVFLKTCRMQYDIIFADPPFEMENAEMIPEMVFKNNLLCDGGWLIVESSSGKNFGNHPNYFDLRKYGKVNFNIFKK